jgi:hypothetical protein
MHVSWNPEQLKIFQKKNILFISLGSPVKAEHLPMIRRMTEDVFADPRPVKYHKNPGFCDRVRNMVFNHCSRSSENLAFRHLHSKANVQVSLENIVIRYLHSKGILRKYIIIC